MKSSCKKHSKLPIWKKCICLLKIEDINDFFNLHLSYKKNLSMQIFLSLFFSWWHSSSERWATLFKVTQLVSYGTKNTSQVHNAHYSCDHWFWRPSFWHLFHSKYLWILHVVLFLDSIFYIWKMSNFV